MTSLNQLLAQPLRLRLALLLSTVLLGACGNSTPAPTAKPVADAAPVISGQLNAPQGSNTFVSIIANNSSIVNTPVDAAGKFSLTLPDADKMADVKTSLSAGLLADLGCTGTLTLSDSSAQGYAFATLLASSGEEYADAAVSRTTLSRTLQGRAYLYADKPTTLKGPLDCTAATGYPTTVQVSISASTGWNVVDVNIQGIFNFGISVNGTVSNGSLAPNSIWANVKDLRTQLEF